MTFSERFELELEARARHERYFCRRCIDHGKITSAGEQFSMGVYAGMLCDACWAADGRNNDRRFDPMDAGESMDEDDGDAR